MELSKYVYFCTQKSSIKAGNNKFQDLMNAPHIYKDIILKTIFSYTPDKAVSYFARVRNFYLTVVHVLCYTLVLMVVT